MLVRKEFPRPDNQLKVLKRYLHVLALIQNDKDPTEWNADKIATMLYSDETGEIYWDEDLKSHNFTCK